MNYGRYDIIREIGRGSTGVVFEAYDPQIDRRVALKVLRQDRLSSESFVKRFLKEAKAIGRLSHPNIVKVYDLWQGQKTMYIAMEHIDGKPLSEMLRERKFAQGEVLRIGEEIAATLDYAHRQGVIHRDIKPANLIVQSDGKIKITDFGIARIDDSYTTLQTMDGEILGTPAYMSPEQVLGNAVDGRSDIFSAGVILYELSTGGRPFGRQRKNLATVFNEIVNIHPPTPVTQNARVQRGFSDIIMKAMSKSPEDRFQTGMEMAEALRAFSEKKTGRGAWRKRANARVSLTKTFATSILALLMCSLAFLAWDVSRWRSYVSYRVQEAIGETRGMISHFVTDLRRVKNHGVEIFKDMREPDSWLLDRARAGVPWTAGVFVVAIGFMVYTAVRWTSRKRGLDEPVPVEELPEWLFEATMTFVHEDVVAVHSDKINVGVTPIEPSGVNGTWEQAALSCEDQYGHSEPEQGVEYGVTLMPGETNACKMEHVEECSADPAQEEKSASIKEAQCPAFALFPVSGPPDFASTEAALWEVALDMMRTCGMKMALGILLGAASGAPSPVEKDRYRLLVARFCLRVGRPDLARPIVEELEAQIEAKSSEFPESQAWVVEVLKTLLECIARGEDSPMDSDRAEALLERLCLAERMVEGQKVWLSGADNCAPGQEYNRVYVYSPAYKVTVDVPVDIAEKVTWFSCQRLVYDGVNKGLQRQAGLFLKNRNLLREEAERLVSGRDELLRRICRRPSPFEELYSVMIQSESGLRSLEQFCQDKVSIEAVLRSVERNRQVIDRIEIVPIVEAEKETIIFRITLTGVVIQEVSAEDSIHCAVGKGGSGIAGAWAGCTSSEALASSSLVVPVFDEVSIGGACSLDEILGGTNIFFSLQHGSETGETETRQPITAVSEFKWAKSGYPRQVYSQ